MAGGIAIGLIAIIFAFLIARVVSRANPFELSPRDFGEQPRIPDEMKHSRGGNP